MLTYMERLHDPTQCVLAGLERQKLIVPVARVVKHSATDFQEISEVSRIRHLRTEADLAAALLEGHANHLQLLIKRQNAQIYIIYCMCMWT